MELFTPSRDLLAFKRNLMAATALLIAKWFLKARALVVPLFAQVSAPPPPPLEYWRIDVLLLVVLAYFTYMYWNSLFRDKRRWEQREGLDGGKERELLDIMNRALGDRVPKDMALGAERIPDGFSGHVDTRSPGVADAVGRYYSARDELKELPDKIARMREESHRRVSIGYYWLPCAATVIASVVGLASLFGWYI